MKLNDLQYTEGSRKSAKRVGRGPGSDMGKTAGRGHKGQHARSGGYKKTGFEGGQMPLQRRIPKRGFRSVDPKGTAEVRLDSLSKLSGDVDLSSLKAAGIVPRQASRAKVVRTGELSSAVNLTGVSVTAGARAAIESAGGSVSE